MKMWIRKLNYYTITSAIQNELTKFTFNNGKHEAKVKSAEIKFSRNNACVVINNLTLSDLKELKKVVRKLIKEIQDE
jgi:hypothetical protein|nr:MAG TPA: hypothetical protein [Caudoviricetes sp.]